MGGGLAIVTGQEGEHKNLLGFNHSFNLSNLPLLSKAKLTNAENTELVPSKTTSDLQVMNTIFLI